MALTIGTRLGPYEILASIGAGGMGEVYRARDSRLDRDVAIKIVPELFATDPERLIRFEREAKTLASLNHPNIAHIHGIEGADIVRALVMEFVDGEDLAQRIARGPIPVEEALPIALQIADALEAAHERAVIHRDLKPANIKVRDDGTVKVLDFGLSKALDPRSSTPDLANSPTFTSPATQLGVILGTAAYMAPEQAKGKAVDKRADIWSFGVVVFEMLAGRSPFAAESVTEVLAHIVSRDPDWTLLPPDTPPPVRHLLKRCLERDPRRRLRDIGDARFVLEEGVGGSAAVAVPSANTSRRWYSLVAVAAVAGWLLAGGIAWLAWPSPSPPPFRKFELPFDGLQVSLGIGPVISPDGRSLAFVAKGNLHVRDLDQLASRQLLSAADAGDVAAPFWSPDGSFVGFASERKLWKVPRMGGERAAICSLPASGQIVGASWGSDDVIAFAVWRQALYQVSARGGVPTVLLQNDASEIDFHDPHFLPDGRHLIFVVHPKVGAAGRVQMLHAGARTTLFELGDAPVTTPGYSLTGHLTFTSGGSNPGVWAVPFNLSTFTTTGDPFPVAARGTRPSVAADGTLAYVALSPGTDVAQLAWVDRSGRIVEAVGSARQAILSAAIAPDGRRIAFAAQESEGSDIWIHDLERAVSQRLTSSPEAEIEPAWSPRGDVLAFVRANRSNSLEGQIIAKRLDDEGSERVLGSGRSPNLSADGALLVFTNPLKGVGTLGLVRIDGNGPPTSVNWPGGSEERDGVISPDGTLIAYESVASGQFEVYVRGFPDGRGKWQVSAQGGRDPRWARTSGELFFISGSGATERVLTAVDVRRTGNRVSIGTPKELFKRSSTAFPTAASITFDVSADGRKLLMVTRAESKPGDAVASSVDPRIVIVQNWFAEFEKR